MLIGVVCGIVVGPLPSWVASASQAEAVILTIMILSAISDYSVDVPVKTTLDSNPESI